VATRCGALKTIPIIGDAFRTAGSGNRQIRRRNARTRRRHSEVETAGGDDQWRFHARGTSFGAQIRPGVRLGNYYPRITFSGRWSREGIWFCSLSAAIHVEHRAGHHEGNTPASSGSGRHIFAAVVARGAERS